MIRMLLTASLMTTTLAASELCSGGAGTPPPGTPDACPATGQQ